MASQDIGVEGRLVRLCIEAASESEESIEKWRMQRRTLERMPFHLAEALLRHLLRRGLLCPSLLEVFKSSVEEIDLSGENSVDAEWMAYLGGFRFLRLLNVADCHRITNSALWSLAGMTALTEVDLSRCSKVTDSGITHFLSIPSLEKVCISETGLTAKGVSLLSSLKNLSILDLGGLPVNDQALSSLQVLRKLQYLDLWGSKISNNGVAVLKMFPKLSFLNLAWTKVTKLPNLSSITCLNMSNCTINSLFEGDAVKVPLAKLIVSRATFANEPGAFSYIKTSSISFLDISGSSLCNFCFLLYMNALEHLDLSFSTMEDDSSQLIASIGVNLRNLDLSNTRITSAGVGILAGHVPNLEVISLSYTHIDDVAILHIGMMPSLKVINLSNTNIKGSIHQVDTEPEWLLSLTALQSLEFLEKLDLEGTQITDASLYPLSSFRTLTSLSLRSVNLTEMSLHHLLSLHKLTNLGIRDAVLTNGGLKSFKPPPALKTLDLRGCWLLTEDAILSFCKCHPRVEIKHEFVHLMPRMSPQVKYKGKMHVSPSRLEGAFLDQRLKYSREELLALQSSYLSLDPRHGRTILIPNMQMD